MVMAEFGIVVVVRFNALSRTIESALQKEGIPNRVLNGRKFFERLEVCHFIRRVVVNALILIDIDQRHFGVSADCR